MQVKVISLMLVVLWNWIQLRNFYSKGVHGFWVREPASSLLALTSAATQTHYETLSTSRLFHNFLSSLTICNLFLLGRLPVCLCGKASNSPYFLHLASQPLSIFILEFNYFSDSAETHSMPRCSPTRFATPQIYVGAEGWLSNFLHGQQCRWHCVCFKSSCQMCVKDVWTAPPCNSSADCPFFFCVSHPAISTECHSDLSREPACVYVCVRIGIYLKG